MGDRSRADRRGVVWSRRALYLLAAVGIGVLLGSCAPNGITIEVNVSTDGNDVHPGDGVCEMTVSAGNCSLRAAIDEANALGNHERVVIATGVHPVLTKVGQDDANVVGDLDVHDNVTIESASGATITASGDR